MTIYRPYVPGQRIHGYEPPKEWPLRQAPYSGFDAFPQPKGPGTLQRFNYGHFSMSTEPSRPGITVQDMSLKNDSRYHSTMRVDNEGVHPQKSGTVGGILGYAGYKDTDNPVKQRLADEYGRNEHFNEAVSQAREAFGLE